MRSLCPPPRAGCGAIGPDSGTLQAFDESIRALLRLPGSDSSALWPATPSAAAEGTVEQKAAERPSTGTRPAAAVAEQPTAPSQSSLGEERGGATRSDGGAAGSAEEKGAVAGWAGQRTRLMVWTHALFGSMGSRQVRCG